jgi:hypothetical protein
MPDLDLAIRFCTVIQLVLLLKLLNSSLSSVILDRLVVFSVRNGIGPDPGPDPDPEPGGSKKVDPSHSYYVPSIDRLPCVIPLILYAGLETRFAMLMTSVSWAFVINMAVG